MCHFENDDDDEGEEEEEDEECVSSPVFLSEGDVFSVTYLAAQLYIYL